MRTSDFSEPCCSALGFSVRWDPKPSAAAVRKQTGVPGARINLVLTVLSALNEAAYGKLELW